MMWWKTLISVITFGIYKGREVAKKEAEDKAAKFSARAETMRERIAAAKAKEKK